MKFIAVRELRGNSGQVWKRLSDEKDMVVTSHGKPIAILSAVTEDAFEETFRAVRTARAKEALSAIQRDAAARGLDRMSLDEINAIIKKARQERRQK